MPSSLFFNNKRVFIAIFKAAKYEFGTKLRNTNYIKLTLIRLANVRIFVHSCPEPVYRLSRHACREQTGTRDYSLICKENS